ncbi:indole-3-glycerol phosphate synthase [Alicyclobacillus contaminans]|uniref:indole-3-glycerol phosphate synthase TrpC n=1 Tax=Alicyclobacillus contaminans TaxID=392016 RepID=UPI0003F754F8|nr:indole-3-glycerol phosphate synthase TrpC [Alicyclobacillus contaminans]GMA48689.1 indole-3-glycerol phosphate synthase [Alicyclobacillus contaminans]
MSTFLSRILDTKREEVALRRSQVPSLIIPGDLPACRGFRRAIAEAEGLAVIAEFKKASPSKGAIAPHLDPVEMATSYASAGATAVSVLTDSRYFQGSLADLERVRAAVDIPVLRKDFIIDEVQIWDARMAGADAVLLIAAALDPERMRELSHYAKSIGLDVLVEVHAVDELPAALAAEPSVLGVNNRNLHTFEVDLETTRQVLRHVPRDVVVIAESGVHSEADAAFLAASGARGILVGEALMRSGGPGGAAAEVARFARAGIGGHRLEGAR